MCKKVQNMNPVTSLTSKYDLLGFLEMFKFSLFEKERKLNFHGERKLVISFTVPDVF